MQFADSVIMVRPAAFGYNTQTAASNAFQQSAANMPGVREAAVKEFDRMVEKLRASDIDVFVWQDGEQPQKPDAIFPNNWFSTHRSGNIFLYPMETENRRAERSLHLIQGLENRFLVKEVIDLSEAEKRGEILEGTGSIILDAKNKVAFAALSSRTSRALFEDWCVREKYKPVSFNATDHAGKAIYHTNVIMCIGHRFAIICLECIRNKSERAAVYKQLVAGKYSVVDISMEQVNHFAGNMLQLTNKSGNKILALSQTAYHALTAKQRRQIERFTRMLPLDVSTVEVVGGGSVRCMLAENFLSKKKPAV